MMNLDELDCYKRLDPSGMLSLLRNFPSQCRAAWQQAQEFNLPSDYRGINKVIVAGVGGSAIAGDLVQSIVEPEGIPVHVYREYIIPPVLDSVSLFIASSHSGNTEETLSAFSSALETLARKIAITTGGRLAHEAKKHGVPTYLISAGDYPPRYALGYSFMGMLGLVSRVCALNIRRVDMEVIFKSLESFNLQLAEDIPTSRNPAKALALKAKGKAIIIYGAGITTAIARRWKSQFNENSKVWAFYESFPELNHNSIEGYELPLQAKKDFLVLMLKSSLLHPRIQLRYEVTAEVLAKAGIPFELVEVEDSPWRVEASSRGEEGNTALSQILKLICLGDYASYYLAILNDRDPAPVNNINFLKSRLA